jgi:hypothetical protein
MGNISRPWIVRLLLMLAYVLLLILGAVPAFLLLSYLTVVLSALNLSIILSALIGLGISVTSFWTAFGIIPARISGNIVQLLALGFPHGFLARSSAKIYIFALLQGFCLGAAIWGLAQVQFSLFGLPRTG